MSIPFHKAMPLSVVLALGTLCTAGAQAGCLSEAFTAPAHLQQQTWHGADPVRLVPVDWRHHEDDIVGYWNIVVTAKGNTGPNAPPDGVVLDAGLQHWHEDGTEFLNSSAQQPRTQNYCMGVWEKTGPYTYKLNHFAYQYDDGTPQKVTGLVRIRETVRLDRDGDRMNGVQTVDIYDTFRNLIAHIQGTLAGKRITIDTTAQEVR